jgi:hypothetical protein
MEHFSHRHEPLMADLVADMTRQPSATTKEVWQLGFIPPAHLRLPWYDYGTAEESTTESRAAAHPSIPPPLYHSSLTINDEAPYVGVPKYKLWKSPSMIFHEAKLASLAHPHGDIEASSMQVQAPCAQNFIHLPVKLRA